MPSNHERALDALLRRLAGLHEAGHEAEEAARPRRIAREQQLAVAVEHARFFAVGDQLVVPVRVAARRAAQPRLGPAVLVGFEQAKRGRALRAEAKPCRHLRRHAGKTPVER